MLRFYLIVYILICFLFWAGYLLSYFGNGMVLDTRGLILLNIAQGLAVLEIFHAIMKWVKSPVMSTVAQVSSRILVVILINIFLSNELLFNQVSAGILTVSIAWGITELVRYSFYFLAQFKVQFSALVWMRYSFFLMLYPLGVTGEWVILSAPAFANGFAITAYNGFLIVALLAYGYYFPVLFKYMLKQRKHKLKS